MKHKLKRVACLLLAVVILVCGIPVSAADLQKPANADKYDMDGYYNAIYSYFSHFMSSDGAWGGLKADDVYAYNVIAEKLDNDTAFRTHLSTVHFLNDLSFSNLFFGEYDSQDIEVQYYVMALSSLLMTMEDNLTDLKATQSKATSSRTWADYGSKFASITANAMSGSASGNIYFKKAFDTCGISIDTISKAISKEKEYQILEQNSYVYLSHRQFLELLMKNGSKRMSKAAEYLITGLDKCFIYRMENFSKIAADADSSEFFSVLDAVLETTEEGTFTSGETAALSVLSKAASLAGSFKIGIDIGQFLGDIIIGSSNHITRYYEISAMAEARKILIAEIENQANQVKNVKSVGKIPQIRDLMLDLTYINARGGYCVYKLQKDDFGLLSSLIKFKNGKKLEQWISNLQSITTGLSTNLDNMIPDIERYKLKENQPLTVSVSEKSLSRYYPDGIQKDWPYYFEYSMPEFKYSDKSYKDQENKLNKFFDDLTESKNHLKGNNNYTSSGDFSNYFTALIMIGYVADMTDSYISVSIGYNGSTHSIVTERHDGYFIDIKTANFLSLKDLFNNYDEFKKYVVEYIYYTYADSEYVSDEDWTINALANKINPDPGNWYIEDGQLYVLKYPLIYGGRDYGDYVFSIPLDICSYYWSNLAKAYFKNITPKDRVILTPPPFYSDTVLFVGQVKANGSVLNVRKEPSTQAEIIGKLADGTFVDVYAEQDGWCQIIYNGQIGYVSKDFINCEIGGYAKPVIYLYPEDVTDVNVRVKFQNGHFTCTYPDYGDGWDVTAYPDGKIINKADGDEYSYLYWEGEGEIEYDFSTGFVVKREDTAEFLKEKLSYMGLLPKEYNEFIVYWLPILQQNEYNLISFQTDNYDNAAKLEISPKPDSMLRVFMAFKAADENTTVKKQQLSKFERTGFSVVEWGGTEVK